MKVFCNLGWRNPSSICSILRIIEGGRKEKERRRTLESLGLCFRSEQDNLLSLEQEIVEDNLMQFPFTPDEAIMERELPERVMSEVEKLTLINPRLLCMVPKEEGKRTLPQENRGNTSCLGIVH